MKKLFLLLTVLVTTLTMQAEGYTYLTFETTDGAKVQRNLYSAKTIQRIGQFIV